MKVKELREKFIADLSAFYDKEELLSFFYILTNKYLGFSKALIALNLDTEIEEPTVNQFKSAKKELIKFKPIQYIIGDTEFYGLDIEVDKNVLIPRPETEELVDWILKDVKPNKKINILDVGTGSGCIAIALKKNIPSARVTAVDLSEKALKLAMSNAKLNNVDVDFRCLDILKVKALDRQYDIIVSNPPYVRDLEKKEIRTNVLDYEPHLALFVKDNDPLVFYLKITDLAKSALKRNGTLYFEINQYLGDETRAMISEKGFEEVFLRKDLYGNDRMIKAEFKKRG